MDEVVLPFERDHPGGEPVSETDIDDLREEARERDIYCPQISEEYGGMGVDFRDVLPVYEQAGRSLLGPGAMRVDASDEGNMNLLEMVGNENQKDRWLEPLVNGEIGSAFSMTEPLQGAGSDPKMIKTTAERDGDEWLINGHKWWTSRGMEADILFVMARTDLESHPHKGCSIFVVPTDAEGVEFIRDVPAMGWKPVGYDQPEVRYMDVRVGDENLLGEKNSGFSHAQQRLGPARLTHCMRFCGMGQRALSVAKAYVSEREAFGSKLKNKQALRHDIAEAETHLHASRAITRHAAEKVAEGKEARIEVAMAKNFVANTIQDIIDTALQACGGAGISKDLPIADFYESIRMIRIGDGPDEVHRRIISRKAFEGVNKQELEPLTRFKSGSDSV
jgi:acyl-CoA dehydrogenase